MAWCVWIVISFAVMFKKKWCIDTLLSYEICVLKLKTIWIKKIYSHSLGFNHGAHFFCKLHNEIWVFILPPKWALNQGFEAYSLVFVVFSVGGTFDIIYCMSLASYVMSSHELKHLEKLNLESKHCLVSFCIQYIFFLPVF